MVFGMAERSAGKRHNIQGAFFPLSLLTGFRSLQKFQNWNEEVVFKGDMARKLKTLASVEDVHRNPKFRMSVIAKRRVNLSVIQKWLQGQHDLNELVIESLSKYMFLS